MGFLGRLIKFVFWVLLVSWVIKLISRMLGGGSSASAPQAGAAPGNDMPVNGKRLVKDPVCGMHMAQELALPMNANGETQYFCSPECREKYESSMLRRAANA